MAAPSQSSVHERESARQKADEVLRATHERFRVIFDSLPAPCVVYDADRRFRFINKAMSEMLRRPEDEIIGCRDEDLMPVQFTQVYLPVLCQAITTRTPQMAECAFTGPFGTLSYVAHYVPLLDDAGEVREIVGISYDISAQKRVERELRQRDEEIRSLAESVPDIVARLNREGQHLYINRRIEEVTGLPRETFLGKTDRELGMPDDLVNLWDQTRLEAFDTGQPVVSEFAYRDSQGTKYFESRLIPEVGPDGAALTVLAITRDISDRRLAQMRLAESEERYRLVVEDQTEIICRFQADGTLTFVNDVYCRFFGQAREALIGKVWHPQAAEEDLPIVLDRLGKLSISHPVVTIENRMRDRTGEFRWMQFVNRGFFDAAGRLIDVQSVGRDITDLKLAQIQLQESEERFRMAFESVPVGMVVLDSKVRAQQVNRALCEMLGYSEAELIGLTPYDITHPDDLAAGREKMSELARGEIPFYTREKRHLTKDGRTIWGRLTTAMVPDHDGKPFRYIGILEDITARRAAEQELARHREHLEELVRSRTRALEASQQTLRSAERLASLGTLAAGIAHEINNPVGTILLAAEMAVAAQSSQDDQTVARCLEGIKADAQRCGRIVKNVLHFARQEPTEKTLHPLNDVVNDAVRRTQGYAADRGARITTALAEDVGLVLMNPFAIEQALTNLLRNSIESPQQQIAIQVTTTAYDEHFEVIIADDGPGIPPDVQMHIFDPFFTMRRTRGGMGLGLSLVHGTVTDHQGRIRVESVADQGTTFTIVLPRGQASP